MRTVSSYGVELRKQNIPIRQTLDIYRSAVSCLIEIYARTWDELAVITEPKKRFNTAEHLVHTTKKNEARFDFDLRFPKMPSYLRRAAIQHALGSVSSYKTADRRTINIQCLADWDSLLPYLSIFSPMANPPPIITTFQIA